MKLDTETRIHNLERKVAQLEREMSELPCPRCKGSREDDVGDACCVCGGTGKRR